MPRPKLPASQADWARRLGSKLRSAREARGLSREALARAAGTSTETVRKIEKGETRSPEFHTVACLAGVLAVDLNDLHEPEAPTATHTTRPTG